MRDGADWWLLLPINLLIFPIQRWNIFYVLHNNFVKLQSGNKKKLFFFFSCKFTNTILLLFHTTNTLINTLLRLWCCICCIYICVNKLHSKEGKRKEIFTFNCVVIAWISNKKKLKNPLAKELQNLQNFPACVNPSDTLLSIVHALRPFFINYYLWWVFLLRHFNFLLFHHKFIELSFL